MDQVQVEALAISQMVDPFGALSNAVVPRGGEYRFLERAADGVRQRRARQAGHGT